MRRGERGGLRVAEADAETARGAHESAVDLDLLIDAAPKSRFSIINLVGVEHIVADSTGLPANAFMRRSLDAPFRKSISSDVIEIF